MKNHSSGRFKFLFIILTSQYCNAFAQENYAIDSLKLIVERTAADSNRVNLYSSLSTIYLEIPEYDSSFHYANEALKLSEKIKFRKGIGDSYLRIGVANDRIGNYPVSIEFLKLAVEQYSAVDFRKGIASCYLNIGKTLSNQSKYSEAIKYLILCLNIRQELQLKSSEGDTYNTIGNVNRLKGDYALAVKNHLQSLRIKEELKDKKGISIACSGLASDYDKLLEDDLCIKYYNEALRIDRELGYSNYTAHDLNGLGIVFARKGKYEEALSNYNESLRIRQTKGSKKEISESLNNIGNLHKIHALSLLSSGDTVAAHKFLETALETHQTALKLREEIGNTSGIGGSYSNIGSTLSYLNQYDDARIYLKRALEVLIKIDHKDFIRNTYLSLSQVDSLQASQPSTSAEQKLLLWKSAYLNYIQYAIFDDSIYSETSSSQIAEMRIQYDTEKKEQEISILNKDAEIQKLNLIKQNVELDKTQLLSEKQKQEIQIKDLSLEKSTLDLGKKEQEKALQKVTFQRINAELKEQNAVREREVDRQKFIRNIFITSLILSAVIAFLLFNRFQLRKKIESQQAIISERVRISRELHDDVGAQLSTAKLFLNDLKKNFHNEKGKILLENSLGLLETSIKDLRVVMDDLRQSTLKDNGYIAAAEELVNTINKRHGIHFNMSHHGITDRLPQVAEHNLFRITQELINNTLKYAEARNVSIHLVKQTDKLIFTYEDDGKGFDQTKAQRGYGLSNIESRIESLDGNIEINSAPGTGFMAIIELPQSKHS
ncbi:hypothetical protein BH11BAC1_BH11BAC1_15410 [soil metagenome]